MSYEYGGGPEMEYAFADLSPEEAPDQKPTGGKIEYPAGEGDTVELQWQRTSPVLKNAKTGAEESARVERGASPGEVVIFLPGVALEADSASVLESSVQFANAKQSEVISVTTRLDNVQRERAQEVQAEAIRKFILEQGFTKVLIVGNSQGAVKGMELAYLLEQRGAENAEMSVAVEGLILTGPGGIVAQSPGDLRNAFFYDAAVTTTPEVLKNAAANPGKNAGAVARSAVLGADVAAGMAKEFARKPGEFAGRVEKEASDAAAVTRHAGEIKAPVVLVVGEIDAAFSSNEFIPAVAHDQTVWSQDAREKKMRDEVFHNAAAVRVLEVRRNGVHGAHYLRGEEVAKTSVYMLKRLARAKNAPEQGA